LKPDNGFDIEVAKRGRAPCGARGLNFRFLT
jgi:hypothetical protein